MLRAGLEAVDVNLAIEVALADAEQAGRLGAAAAGRVEGARDLLPFHLAQRAECPGRRRRTSPARSRLVAAMTRTSTRISTVPPTRRNVPRSSTRSRVT